LNTAAARVDRPSSRADWSVRRMLAMATCPGAELSRELELGGCQEGVSWEQRLGSFCSLSHHGGVAKTRYRVAHSSRARGGFGVVLRTFYVRIKMASVSRRGMLPLKELVTLELGLDRRHRCVAVTCSEKPGCT